MTPKLISRYSAQREEKVRSTSGASHGIRACQVATINTLSACRTITSVESEKMLDLMSAAGIFLMIIEAETNAGRPKVQWIDKMGQRGIHTYLGMCGGYEIRSAEIGKKER